MLNFYFYNFKERYKNLAAIKSTEWNEPKMLLKIILTYYRNHKDEVFILFQILSVFSNRFPIDINVSFICYLCVLIFFNFIETVF